MATSTGAAKSQDIAAQDREQFIRNLVRADFGREVVELDRLTGGLNTFVYRLKVTGADSSHEQQPRARAQPEVSPLPDAGTQLVIRLSNPASGLNENIRVQNEVAVMTLTREALKPLNPSLVPVLYGWASGETGRGWTLCEHMAGEHLGEKFESLGDEAKRIVIAQIAQLLKHIQQFRLPSSIKGYGGLGFARDGSIVTGPTVIAGGGPSETHSAFDAECLQTQRELSEKCEVVQGWRGTDFPARIERLAKEKFTATCEWEQELRPTLVHADFDIHNMLFDPETNRITGLVDYDFGHIGCQADEYMYSLSRLGYLVLPIVKENEDLLLLRKFLVHGVEYEQLASRPNTAVDWKLAIMVDEEFAKAGVERPRDIAAMDEISTWYWVIQGVSPPIFFLARCREWGPEKLQKMKEGEQKELDNNLEALGY